MGLVEFVQEEGWGRIVLNRPSAGNSVFPALVDDLSSAVSEAETAPIQALLLSGRGDNFCFGGDVRFLAEAATNASQELRGMATLFHQAQVRITRLPVPVVSAVQGHAIGGGFGFALTADFLICSDNARFSTGYARLGLSSDAGVSFFLTRALGARRAAVLLMQANFFDASEALGMGLVDRVVPLADLAIEAERWVAHLAAGPTAAYAAIKRLVEAADGRDFQAQLDRETEELVTLAERPDALAAVAAIAAGQKPTFTN